MKWSSMNCNKKCLTLNKTRLAIFAFTWEIWITDSRLHSLIWIIQMYAISPLVWSKVRTNSSKHSTRATIRVTQSLKLTLFLPTRCPQMMKATSTRGIRRQATAIDVCLRKICLLNTQSMFIGACMMSLVVTTDLSNLESLWRISKCHSIMILANCSIRLSLGKDMVSYASKRLNWV